MKTKTLSVEFAARQPLSHIAVQVREDLNVRVSEVLSAMGSCACDRCVAVKVDDLLVGHGLVMAAVHAVARNFTFDPTLEGVRELMKDVPHRIVERAKNRACLH